MTVGSLFAGIGGFDLGFERNGFEVRWQAEQDGKAQAVLSARFPSARLHDDVRTIGAGNLEPVDVICGGFPCQDVSVAGKREGLGGERTGLFWQVVRIAREIQPRWMVLENVPGLLSSHGGRDFHTVLSALADVGFRRAYRILDSRYFGVAQRRRRVFIVLRARRCGDGAEAVLFEPASGNRDSQESGEARTDLAYCLAARAGGVGGGRQGLGQGWNTTYSIGSHAGAADGDQTNRNHASGGPVGMNISRELAYSLRAGRPGNIAATLNSGGNDGGFRTEPGEHLVEVSRPLVQSMHKRQHGVTEDGTGRGVPLAPSGVRRLTPLECERLQGFPDGWTCLCGEGHRGSRFCTCGDSHRYRQLGNAVTVPVAAWIARRIRQVEERLSA